MSHHPAISCEESEKYDEDLLELLARPILTATATMDASVNNSSNTNANNSSNNNINNSVLSSSTNSTGTTNATHNGIQHGSYGSSVYGNNYTSVSPVRKRTSSYHSVHSTTNNVINADDLARFLDGDSDLLLDQSSLRSPGRRGDSRSRHHRRNNSRSSVGSSGGGRRGPQSSAKQHMRYASWGGQSAQQRFFDPNDPLAPPIARKKVNNKFSAFRNNSVILERRASLPSDHPQQLQHVSDDNISDISPLSPPTTTNEPYSFDNFLTHAVSQTANDNDGMILTDPYAVSNMKEDKSSVVEKKSQNKQIIPAFPPISGSSSSNVPSDPPNFIETNSSNAKAFDSDDSSSSIDSDLLIPPRNSGPQKLSRIDKSKTNNVPVVGNRARLSSSGTISSVEDYYREIGAPQPISTGAAHSSYWNNNPNASNRYKPYQRQDNQQVSDLTLTDSQFIDEADHFIEGFDFDKNRPSLDSSGHHGSEFMTYSVKSLSYGDDVEEGVDINPVTGIDHSYGSITNMNPSFLKSDENISLIKKYEDVSKLQHENIFSSDQSDYGIDRVFSSVRSVSTADKEAEFNDSEIYMMSDILARAFPDRLVALIVTLVIEIPVLLMINGGSGRICKLIGRHRYQLLMAFLPLASAISGNCGLQGSSLTTRAISHMHVTRKTYMNWLMAEIGVASFLGLIMGFIMGLFAYLASGMDTAFGMTICIGQFLSVLTAGFTGTIAPILFTFIFRRDSGKWSGPLETAIQDIIGSFAMVILSYHIILWFGPQEVEPWDVCGTEE